MLKMGVNRRVDSFGRIVIPKEFRRSYHIEVNEELEVMGTDEGILLKVPNVIIERKEQTK